MPGLTVGLGMGALAESVKRQLGVSKEGGSSAMYHAYYYFSIVNSNFQNHITQKNL